MYCNLCFIITHLDGEPVAFTGKGIGWQANPTREDACLPRPYVIEGLPVDGPALDPPLQQFTVLPLFHPGGDHFLAILVCGKDADPIMSFRLSSIPVTFLL